MGIDVIVHYNKFGQAPNRHSINKKATSRAEMTFCDSFIMWPDWRVSVRDTREQQAGSCRRQWRWYHDRYRVILPQDARLPVASRYSLSLFRSRAVSLSQNRPRNPVWVPMSLNNFLLSPGHSLSWRWSLWCLPWYRDFQRYPLWR